MCVETLAFWRGKQQRGAKINKLSKQSTHGVQVGLEVVGRQQRRELGRQADAAQHAALGGGDVHLAAQRGGDLFFLR